MDSYLPPNLALINLSVSEKSSFTDDDDGRPRHGISPPDTVKQN